MAKGYWIAHVTVHDPVRYKDYVAANGAPISAFGGRFVVRGGRYEVRAGSERERHVVIEFDSFEIAKACYDSPEYAAAARIRDEAATVDIVIAEGYE